MLAIARKNAIREQLREKKSVSISDLAEELGVTKETIRRDLREMEQADELVRTHGGAYILEGVQNDLDTHLREVTKVQEKELIAQKCDSIIQTGDYLFLDGSTTCWFIARRLVDRKVSVLTNSLEIANILSDSNSVKLHMIGGEFSQENKYFIGEDTIRSLEHHFVDKAIISCRTVDLEHGITDTNDTQAKLHETILEHAGQKYLAVDSSKLDKVSFSFVAPLTILNGIILDQEFPDEWAQYLDEHDIKIF